MKINQLLQQAQSMQKKMEAIQVRLETLLVEGGSGAGLITATVNGKGELKKIKIDPTLLEDGEMLEDLIVAAFNDAKAKADQMAADEMAKVTGDLKLPGGMKLPF